MGPATTTRVAILEGNATMARLMREFLEEETFEVEFLRGVPPGAPRAHLVIIDVDSGLETIDHWLRHCDGRQLPVLVCGVERSRDAYAEWPWLSRPFTSTQLTQICREVLGQTSTDGDGDEIPPPIQVGPDQTERPTVEIPTAELDDEDEGYDLVLRRSAAQRESPDEQGEVFDLDMDGTGSMILEIENISERKSSGGMLVGKGKRRDYTDEELTGDNPWSDVPDTAVETAQETSKPRPRPSVDSMLSPLDSALVAPSRQADVTTVSTWDDVAGGDFSSVHRISTLLAEHWDRLGLTARPADRADRLQRVLSAMWRDGMEGLLEELKRIPAVHGFSGRLETLPLVDLFHTIRDRRLRGRLEIGLRSHSFVLYVDCVTLQDIDSLGESTDGVLLKSLRETGALDEDSYRHYRSGLDEYDSEPLEIRLRRDALVDDEDLLRAKKVRAKKLLRKMCDGQQGTFAFIEVPLGSRQPWPTKGLDLNVDALLLEVLREGSVNPGRARSTSRANLVINSGRAASFETNALTEEERKMLNFFQDGRSLENARDALGETDEPVERVVERLKRLELLRRLGQNSSTPSAQEESGSAADADHPQQRPTRVSSSWNIQLPEYADEPKAGIPGGWPEPAEAGPEEETQQEVGFSAGVPEEFDSWEEDIGDFLSGAHEPLKSDPSDEDS